MDDQQLGAVTGALQALLVTVARIEERQTATTALVEKLASKGDLAQLGARLDKVESNQSRVVWGILGVCGITLASFLGIPTKFK